MENSLDAVRELIKNKTAAGPPKAVIIVGIGGSNLGARAVYDALYGHENYWSNRRPRLIFLDNLDTDLSRELNNWLAGNVFVSGDILAVIISKTGRTLETKLNSELVLAVLKNRLSALNADYREHVVAVTDRDSPLWSLAATEGFATLPIPEETGGRFSVFTAVGLLPLGLAGADIDEFIRGQQAAEQFSATTAAEKTFKYFQAGKIVYDFFFFDGRLETLGAWCRQLMAESLGKSGQGFLPTVSVAERDLHSVLQLYLDGQTNRLTHFISLANINDDEVVRAKRAIWQTVKDVYAARGLPFVETIFPEISEYQLGLFMQNMIYEILSLAKLFGVNPLGQPAVDDYKNKLGKFL